MTQEQKRLLVVDDEAGHRLMVRAVMEDLGWEVTEAADGAACLERLGRGEPVDVVLLDMRMPGLAGDETLRCIRRDLPALPVVMLTAYGSVGSAVEAMKDGAFDFLTKPADNEELAAVLEKAREYGRYLAPLASVSHHAAAGPETMVGESLPMRRLKDLVRQAGQSEATILITGESGSGKELVADALHAVSARAHKPLVKVNCAALPEALLESELFGYKKGAFTGAVKDKPGRFVLADGGALFLDEVGELPLAVQAKLLRVIQERIVEPLGGVAGAPVDVRLLAATNRDLQTMVREGTFREDLYYRLNVLEVHTPPLRDRLDDLPLLVATLLEKLGRKNRREVRGVTREFTQALARHDWPGNVRELENVLERALVLTRTDDLDVETLPPALLEPRNASPAPLSGVAPYSGSDAFTPPSPPWKERSATPFWKPCAAAMTTVNARRRPWA